MFIDWDGNHIYCFTETRLDSHGVCLIFYRIGNCSVLEEVRKNHANGDWHGK